MNQLTLHRNDDTLEGFTFLDIEDVSNEFTEAKTVYAMELRQRMYGDEWEFTALHSPSWDNVILTGNQSMSEEEYQEQAVAAFCYFSVILK